MSDRAARKKYKESEKGRAADLRYRQSAKGRATRKRAMERYRQTEKGRETVRLYQQSEKGQAARRRYDQKRGASIDRYLQRREHSLLRQRERIVAKLQELTEGVPSA